MTIDGGSWRTPAFRGAVIARIDEAIQKTEIPTTKNSADMENHLFQKAKNKEEYLGFAARLILYLREPNPQKPGYDTTASTQYGNEL